MSTSHPSVSEDQPEARRGTGRGFGGKGEAREDGGAQPKWGKVGQDAHISRTAKTGGRKGALVVPLCSENTRTSRG